MNERYGVKSKGLKLKTVIEESNQRMLAKSAKIRRYEQRSEQLRQNRIYDFDQRICADFNGGWVSRMMRQMQKKVKGMGRYLKCWKRAYSRGRMAERKGTANLDR